MSKSVLISIQPKWCELIASGKKTVEVRKTKPKIDVPFKCYIYCTKDSKLQFWKAKSYSYADDHSHNAFDKCGNGKVIGEFVCDKVDGFYYGIQEPWDATSWQDCYEGYCEELYEMNTCLTVGEINDYGNGKFLYAWHISNLKIYDKPKELYEFQRPCKNDCDNCEYLDVGEVGAYEHTAIVKTCLNIITKPPQSWCYVEELQEE